MRHEQLLVFHQIDLFAFMYVTNEVMVTPFPIYFVHDIDELLETDLI